MKTAKANADVEDRCLERVVRRNSQSMVNSIFNPKASGRPFLQKKYSDGDGTIDEEREERRRRRRERKGKLLVTIGRFLLPYF